MVWGRGILRGKTTVRNSGEECEQNSRRKQGAAFKET